MPTLFEDITSRDSHRIWSSSCAIARLRDTAKLEALGARIPEIREHTEGVELDGALVSNKVHLKFALRKLEYYRDKAGCLCRLYPEYPFYNPKWEADDGNVVILETGASAVAWITYTCRCTVCGTTYLVEEGESHYTWWDWKVIAGE